MQFRFLKTLLLMLCLTGCSDGQEPVQQESTPDSAAGGNGTPMDMGDMGDMGGMVMDGDAGDATALDLGSRPGAEPLGVEIHRLANDQLVRGLTHIAFMPNLIEILPLEASQSGYSAQRDHAVVTVPLMDAYFELGESVVVPFDGPIAERCSDEQWDDACFSEVVARIGQSFFRRRLTEAEHERYTDFFRFEYEVSGRQSAVGALVEAFIVSPNHLYRVEVGVAADNAEEVRLTETELASRLAYFLTRTAPDEDLLGDARTMQLLRPGRLAEHVDRILNADPERCCPKGTIKTSLDRFVAEWLRFDLSPNDTLFTIEGVPSEVPEEAQRFFSAVVLADDARLETVLTAPWSMMLPKLANYYGTRIDGVRAGAIDSLPPMTRLNGESIPAGREGSLCDSHELCDEGLGCLKQFTGGDWAVGEPGMCLPANNCSEESPCEAGRRCCSIIYASDVFTSCLDDSIGPDLCQPPELFQFDWFRVDVSAAQRKGILTAPGLLLAHTGPESKILSAIRRGRLIRERLLCQPVGAPPPGVEEVGGEFEALNPNAPPREILEVHREDVNCAACHLQMDPLGLPFESYDDRGMWRANYEDGTAIDTRGEIIGTSVDQSVENAHELIDTLAGSEDVARCFVRQFFQYAFGRAPTLDDMPALNTYTEGFMASDGNIRTLIRTIALSDWFARVHPPEELAQ